MEKIFMAHGLPLGRTGNQAVRLSGRERPERMAPSLHLEGHRIAYNTYEGLAYLVGIIGFTAIATFTGVGAWAIARIADAIYQNTQSVKDEESLPIEPTATPNRSVGTVIRAEIANLGLMPKYDGFFDAVDRRNAALFSEAGVVTPEPSK